MSDTPTAEKDAPVCQCALRNVGHTHECLADRIARLERIVARVVPPAKPEEAPDARA